MANYTKGTVTITEGSSAVAGAGTAWSGKGFEGRYMTFDGLNQPYQVALVQDDATILLTRPILLTGSSPGFALTAQSYSLNDSFTPNLSAPIIRKDDIDKQPRFVRAFTAIDRQKTLVDGYQRREQIAPAIVSMDLGVAGNFDFFGLLPIPVSVVYTPMMLDLSCADFLPFF